MKKVNGEGRMSSLNISKRGITMKKTLIFVMAAVCIFASLLVSCSNEAKLSDEPVRIRFGFDQSRGLNASQNIPKVNELYWYYKANRTAGTDSENINFGATTEWTKVGRDESAGLNGIITLAQGRWDFELQGRKTAEDSTAVYQGSISSVLILKDGNTVNTITVPVSPLTVGRGTVIISEEIIVKKNLSDDSGYKPTHYKYKATTAETYGNDIPLQKNGDGLVNTEVQLDAGTYDFVVMYKGTDTIPGTNNPIIYASAPITVTVSANIETTISGSLEVITAPGQFDVVEVVGSKATASVDSNTAGVVSVVVPIAPSEEQGADTTVTFEAGALPSDAKKVVTEVKTVEEAQAANFSVSNGQTAVAAIDLKITDESGNVKSVEGGKTVTVTTNILKGLNSNSISVKYNGTDGDQPTDIQYNPVTGRLSFKTTHFSEFYVVSDAVCYVVETNTAYYALDSAIDSARDNSTVFVLKNIDVSRPIKVNRGNNITLDLNGKNIVADFSEVNGANSLIDTDATSLEIKDSVGTGKIVSDEYAITASNGGTITITNGTIEAGYAVLAGNNTTGDMNFIINGGTLTSTHCEAIYMPGQQTLTITGGTINGGISARMGQINISGGTINGMTSGQAADSFDEYWNYSGSAWIGDAIYVWGGTYTSANATYGNSCNITITGGTINGNAHNAIAVYDIANNYDQTIAVNISGDAVVNGSIVEDHSKKQNNGKVVTTTWEISGGSFVGFTLANVIGNNEDGRRRNITFIGNGTQTVDVVKETVYAEGGWLNYQRGSSFTFENLTIKAGEGTYDGIVCDELTFKNCTITGKLTLYGKATFINCTFENTMANQYSIWTWGGTDVTFDRCTFNTNGKAILLYGSAPTNLVVNNCTFNDRNNGAAGKAAIEIGNDYNATYTLTVNNATVNGFADGKNTDSKLWANKNSMDAAHLTVTIDGNQVQ